MNLICRLRNKQLKYFIGLNVLKDRYKLITFFCGGSPGSFLSYFTRPEGKFTIKFVLMLLLDRISYTSLVLDINDI